MTVEVDHIIAVNRSANTGCYAGYTTNGSHTDGSYHEREGTPSATGNIGLAVDFDAPGTDAAKLLACARVFLAQSRRLFELFHTPLGFSVKRGQVVQWTIPGHYDHVHVAVAKGVFLDVPAWPQPTPPALEIDMVSYEWADGATAFMNSKGEVFCPSVPGRPTAKHWGGMTNLRDDAKRSFSGNATALVGVDKNNSQAGYFIMDDSWDDKYKFDASAAQFFKK